MPEPKAKMEKGIFWWTVWGKKPTTCEFGNQKGGTGAQRMRAYGGGWVFCRRKRG